MGRIEEDVGDRGAGHHRHGGPVLHRRRHRGLRGAPRGARAGRRLHRPERPRGLRLRHNGCYPIRFTSIK